MSLKAKQFSKMFFMWFMILVYFAYSVGFVWTMISLIKNEAQFDAYLKVIALFYGIAVVYLIICKCIIDKKTEIIPSLDGAWDFIKLVLYPIHFVITGFDEIGYMWGYSTGVLRKYTGFDLLSINRFLVAIVMAAATFFIVALFFNSVIEDTTFILLTSLLTGVIILIAHFLWDVLDFEHKENRIGCIIKNIVFGIVYLIVVLYTILACTETFPVLEEGYFKCVCQAYACTGGLAYVGFYVIFIQIGRIPENDAKFAPLFALLAAVVTALLGGLLLEWSKVVLIIFIVLIAVGICLYAIFVGLPFFVASAPYRRTYKKNTSSTGTGSTTPPVTPPADDQKNLKTELMECSNLKSFMISQRASGKHIGQGINLDIIQVMIGACYFGTCRYRISYKVKVDKSRYLYNGRPDEVAIRCDLNEVDRYLDSIEADFKSRTHSKINSLASEYKGYGGRSWSVTVKFEKIS